MGTMAEPGRSLDLTFTPAAVEFIQSVATGRAPDGGTYDEFAIVGTRGEGKTWATLMAILMHAKEHEARTFALPVPWFWFRDTFPNHERNLLEDLQAPIWQGLWHQYEGGRVVQAEMAGATIVKAFLFGLEDTQAIERMRGGCVGVYGEEPAPASAFRLGSGWSEASWALALSSQGRSSNTHYSPAVIASNYPDKNHWFWRRFYAERQPQCYGFRLQPGDRTTPEYRARLDRTLRSQPSMHRRLYVGEPAPPTLGDPVVTGYREAVHRTYRPLPIASGPLVCGWDFWHHPAAVVASIAPSGQLRVHYAKRLDAADIGVLIDEYVGPWLGANGLQGRELLHTGDPSGDTGDQSDKQHSAVKTLLRKLPGRWVPSTNVLTTLQIAVGETLRRTLSTGDPAILLGPEAEALEEAWAGGWHLNEADKPVQTGERGQHSHVGMAGAYVVHTVFGGMATGRDLSRWANQTAYTQPWDGAGPNERSPSPAAGVLERVAPGSAAYRERWTRQYKED